MIKPNNNLLTKFLDFSDKHYQEIIIIIIVFIMLIFTFISNFIITF